MCSHSVGHNTAACEIEIILLRISAGNVKRKYLQRTERETVGCVSKKFLAEKVLKMSDAFIVTNNA